MNCRCRQLFNLSHHKVPLKSSTSFVAMHDFVSSNVSDTGGETGAPSSKSAVFPTKSGGFWGDVLGKEKGGDVQVSRQESSRTGFDGAGSRSSRGEGSGASREDAAAVAPEAAENVPRLASSERFWRAAVIALVLAATNPGSVGRKLWETSPTMRCLMQV